MLIHALPQLLQPTCEILTDFEQLHHLRLQNPNTKSSTPGLRGIKGHRTGYMV
jgi:hypothetical protein